MVKASNRETVVLERKVVPEGTCVIREGDVGYSAFLIQSGSVQVYTVCNDKEIELARLGIGQIFGEMALVFDEPRSASVRTLEDSNLIVISRQTFQSKLERSDPTVRAILPMLMKRLTHSNNLILRRNSSFDNLVDTVTAIAENMKLSLPSAQKETLENNVCPKLDEFLKAARAFKETYMDES